MMVGLSLMKVSSCSQRVRPPNTATNTAPINGTMASLRVMVQDTARATAVAAMKTPVPQKIPPLALAMKNETSGPHSTKMRSQEGMR